MKGYTSLSQSKKLAEILPIESADMRYGYIAPYDYSDRMYDGGYDDVPYPKDFMKRNPNFSENEYDGELPCWSLAALLDIIPYAIHKSDNEFYRLEIDKGYNDYAIWYSNNGLTVNDLDVTSDNFVDACVKMILKLHEQNLL